jgi:FkbM family methyltransferase
LLIQRIGRWTLDGSELIATSENGDRFSLSFPEDSGWETIYFGGAFETGTTRVILALLHDASIVFDVGANIGWYTVLAARMAPQGQCHAFEPVPRIFEKLLQNCRLNGLGDNVVANCLALGEGDGYAELYTFRGLPHGHSSRSDLGRTDFTAHRARMTTLDRYVREKAIGRVDLVKLDVEGGEMAVLRGANTLFELPSPPIWIIEMNVETAPLFDYAPEDLLEYVRARGNYQFVRIKEGWGRVHRMESLGGYAHGDNVVAVPGSREDALRTLHRVGST